MNESRITTSAVAFLFAALILGICGCEEIAAILSGGEAPPIDGGDIDDSTTYVIDDLPIQDASVAITENDPPQVNLEIKGYLADSCTMLHGHSIQREDNTIHVEVETIRSEDLACAAVITEIEHTVPLGSFGSGMYAGNINGHEFEFEIP